MECLVKGGQFIMPVRWSIFKIAGDNVASVDEMAGLRAKTSLSRHICCLCWTVYLLHRAPASVFLEWVSGDLKPADCFSRIDADFGGDFGVANKPAWDHFTALQAFPQLPYSVWVIGFCKGQTAAPGSLTQ